MFHISYEDAHRWVSGVVKGNEDYVYRPPGNDGGCMYWDVDGNQPSCLIGHALYENTPLTAEDFLANGWNQSVIGHFLTYLHDEGKVTFDQKASIFMQVVQLRQDVRETWGDCLRAGLVEANRPDMQG